jgi:DNA mismatch repair protein MutS
MGPKKTQKKENTCALVDGTAAPEMVTNEEDSIYKTYFQLTDEYYAKYGKKTVVLLQVGSFFEIYGMLTLNKEGYKKYNGSEIEEIAQITNLAIAEKKYTYKNCQVVMSGFRDYFVDKYLQKITDGGYTCVVYVQEKVENTKKYIRTFHSVHSPGTFLSCETDGTPQQSNNVMCIWIEFTNQSLFGLKSGTPMASIGGAGAGGRGERTAGKQMIYGVCAVNTYTGKSTMFEYCVPYFIMNPTSFDELERFVSTHNPAELIFIHPFVEESEVNSVLQYIGVKCSTVHKIGISKKDSVSRYIIEKVENCQKQKYIKEILVSVCANIMAEAAIKENAIYEFDHYPFATQTFCYLLNFLQEHNETLVKKISIPEFTNSSKQMVLANHTLKQLNIIDDNMHHHHSNGGIGSSSSSSGGNGDENISNNLSSVCSFLNKCCTAIGKRIFNSQLTMPTFNVNWLNKEYSMISLLLKETKNFYVAMFRTKLKEIYDIEKLMRQIIARKIYPSSIHKLYKSLECAYQIFTCIADETELNHYLCGSGGISSRYHGHKDDPDIDHDTEDDMNEGCVNSNIMDTINKVLCMIKTWIDIDVCAKENSMTTFDSNFIVQGKNLELDVLIQTNETQKTLFVEIKEYLNKIMQTQEKNNDTDYIKIYETEKGGATLQLTKKRSQTLKKYFDGLLSANANSCFHVQQEKIYVKDIKFLSCTSLNDEIYIPLLTQTSKELLDYKEKINSAIRNSFFCFLCEIEEDYYSYLQCISGIIGKLDVLQSKVYVAQKYNYCCPSIVDTIHQNGYPTQNSFVEALGLRHCLIEHIQQNELYVSNDIYLGNKDNMDESSGTKHEKGENMPNLYNGILLYGTNAVGKTSLIRALGIAVIIAQAGCFVPCTKFTYRPYTSIFSRILGNDNLFKGMSTFAVEMSELRIILKMANENSLILGDELCSGTETESALSIFTAGLMDLTCKKSSFIFATHFHEIVNFQEIKSLCEDGRLGLKHLAVIYNRERQCLVYDRKLMDGPGTRMYGLEVCKYLQLPADFLEKAYEVRNKYFPETKGILSFSVSKKYNSNKIKGICESCGEKCGEEVHHLLEQKYADKHGFIMSGNVHKNHEANLMVLCNECHKNMHNDVKSKNDIISGMVETEGNPGRCDNDGVISGIMKKKSLDGNYVFVKDTVKKKM